MTASRIAPYAFIFIAAIIISTPANADPCEEAVKKSNAHNNETLRRQIEIIGDMGKLGLEESKCRIARHYLVRETEMLPLAIEAERLCGQRLKTKCNSACARKNIQEYKEQVARDCPAVPR